MLASINCSFYVFCFRLVEMPSHWWYLQKFPAHSTNIKFFLASFSIQVLVSGLLAVWHWFPAAYSYWWWCHVRLVSSFCSVLHNHHTIFCIQLLLVVLSHFGAGLSWTLRLSFCWEFGQLHGISRLLFWNMLSFYVSVVAFPSYVVKS